MRFDEKSERMSTDARVTKKDSLAFLRELKAAGEDGLLSENIKYDKFKRLARFASISTKFYEGFESSLDKYPVMNKKRLLGGYQEHSADGKELGEEVNELKVAKTSGSTGTPFKVFLNREKEVRRVAELKFFAELSGAKPNARMIQLRSGLSLGKQEYGYNAEHDLYTYDSTKLSEERLEKLCRLCQEAEIESIIGYASHLAEMAIYVSANKDYLPRTLKSAIAVSEQLDDSDREIWEKAFSFDLVSRYSNEECGVLAQRRVGESCFFANPANYIIEILSLESDCRVSVGDKGRVVVTDLHNFAFPLIRYDTGDIATCLKLSHQGYVVELGEIYGRMQDMVYDVSGEMVHPLGIARKIKQFDEISDWQFVQVSKNKYEVKVVANKEFDTCELEGELKKLLGIMAIVNFQQVANIPALKSGKRKTVSCEL